MRRHSDREATFRRPVRSGRCSISEAMTASSVTWQSGPLAETVVGAAECPAGFLVHQAGLHLTGRDRGTCVPRWPLPDYPEDGCFIVWNAWLEDATEAGLSLLLRA